MRKLLTLLMGIHECSSPAEVRRQYQRLVSGLISAESECNEDQLRRYKKARERLSMAFERAKKHLTQAQPTSNIGSVTGSGLLLGELLKDAELISNEQLEDALEAQAKSKPPLPLGRILVARKLISWEQLAHFLRLQDLLQLEPIHPQRVTRQLMELGIVTRSEIEIAELDCETTGCSISFAIGRRGWVSPSLLNLLTGTIEKPKKPEGALPPSAIFNEKILSRTVT